MKKLTLILIIAGSVFFSSCASVFSGSKCKLQLNSEPQGADVSINQEHVGTTPCIVKIKKREMKGGGAEIEFTLNENGVIKKKQVVLDRHIMAGYIVADIVFNFAFLPIIIDAISGNWFTADKNKINVKFD